MRRRRGLGRSALLAAVVVVLLIVVVGTFALTLSGSKPTASASTSTSTRSASASVSTSIASTSTTGYNLSQPIGITYDAANGDVYVTNNFTSTVSVVNVASDELVATLPTGFAPAQSAVDTNDDYVYVTNNDSGTVTVIDGSSNTVVTTIRTDGLYPDGIAFDPVNNCMYVAEHGNGEGSDGIEVINATSATFKQNIVSLYSPTGVAYDPLDGDVYVTTGISAVAVVDPVTNVIVAQVGVGMGPSGIAFDPANGDLYVANSISGTVSVINGSSGESSKNTVVATINVSTSVVSVPYLVAYDPANGYVMVSNDYSSGVNVINGTTNKLLTTVSTGFQSEPAGLAFDPANGEMYVVGHASYSVVGISTSLTATYLVPPPYAPSTTSTSSGTSTNLDN